MDFIEIQKQGRFFTIFIGFQTRIKSMLQPFENIDDINESGRQALRAFIQRAEVRLSTMHRIAGIFINGAGLLVLLPAFFTNSFMQIIATLVTMFNAETSTPNLVKLIILTAPVIASIFIPLLSLYLLIRDIVQFYFSANNPGFPRDLFHPRFALTAVALPHDEPDDIKRRIFNIQYKIGPSIREFVIPTHAKEAKYFSDVVTKTKGKIIPSTRANILAERPNPAIISTDDSGSYQVYQDHVNEFNAALGLASLVDRSLCEEAAKMEVSLVRHALVLRRLVLRYIKALLIFIWTTLISIAIAYFFKLAETNNNANFNHFLTVGFWGYGIWSITTPIVVQRPIRWIYWEFDQNYDDNTRDTHLKSFELFVVFTCLACAVSIMLDSFITNNAAVGWLSLLGIILVSTVTFFKKMKYFS